MDTIADRDAKRLKFLHRLYEVSEGYEFNFANLFEIGQDIGLDREEAGRIARHARLYES